MYVEGPQIDELTVGKIARKNQFYAKKSASFSAILVDTNLSYLTLEEPGRQTFDTRSTSGVPLETLGYDGSN